MPQKKQTPTNPQSILVDTLFSAPWVPSKGLLLAHSVAAVFPDMIQRSIARLCLLSLLLVLILAIGFLNKSYLLYD